MTVQFGRNHSSSSDGSGASTTEHHEKKSVELPIQKALEVQLISQLSLREKNVVWLNPQDYAELFGKIDTETTNYVQIASQVFRVSVASLEPGHIGMTEIQIDSAGDGIYASTGGRELSVSPFFTQDFIPYPIRKLEIQIDDERSHFHDDDQRIITLDQIKRQVRKLLQDEVITRNKKLILNLPEGPIKVSIEAIYPAKGFHNSPSPIGMLLPDTEFNIVHRLSPHVELVDKVYREEIDRMDFHVSITKRTDSATRDTLPLPISEEQIVRYVLKKYANTIISTGAQFVIKHPSGWDITVTFKNGILKKEEAAASKSRVIDFKHGFVLSEKTPLRILHHRDIILTKGEPQPAAQITFKITDMPGTQTTSIDHDKERWISLEELKSALASLKRPFVTKETFEVALSSGNFLIEVRKAHGLEETFKANDREPLWTLSSDTDIKIIAEKDLMVNVLRDNTAHPIKKTMIQIVAERIPDDGLTITLEKLKAFAVRQAPEHLVTNHRFSVVTDDMDRLEYTILRSIFDDSVGTTKDVSVFGTVTEDTEIDFSTNSKENVTLVDQVHSENVKSMRFSLRASKQIDVATHARPPIIIGRNVLTQFIRDELDNHPFITEGFKTTLQLENGWSIEFTFRKGIVEKDPSSKNESLVKSSTLLKEGYSITEETEVQFVGGRDLISITQGDPILAGRMHFKVTEVKDDFTTRDTSLEKGAWINIEEMKHELLSLGKTFAIGEKILIELESGRYIIEVNGVKPEDTKATLPKKRRETVWKIADETKIHVAVDPGIDLNPIDNGTLHPLEKIKFIAYPDKRSGEHISIKEEELKEALLEVHPERFVKGQILSLETRSNHAILVEVDELTLKDERSNFNMQRIFTQITDKTEIVFRGKEKTNMAIRSEPKVLEVDDPIEYLEDLGMAGIDKEFEQVFRIFYSRSDKLIEEARRRGTKPIKGVLLYGPPGTGKTTLARHVGEMLGCSGERLQLITATEVFNMYFGQSEENIRELFAPAREAQAKYGDKSPLYIVIVDEIDALLPQRGGSINKVRDSLVNQFLGEMDGLKELSNLLVIGLTNRKDEIDPAALRHGRLGVHVEIGLPDRKARLKIFEVHTRKLAKEGLMHESVNLEVLADKTDKLPGAAIEGIVESASLFSLERLSKLKCSKSELRTHPDGMVRMNDFERAMKELHKDNEIPDSIRHLYV